LLLLLKELKVAKLVPTAATYSTVLDALQKANEAQKADTIYQQMLAANLAKSYWSDSVKGKLNFDRFSLGEASAAMRVVLHGMVNNASTDNSVSNSDTGASGSYVHNAQHDLHIITGHAKSTYAKIAGVLKLHMINMLKGLGIECSVNPAIISELFVTSSELQQYITRSTQASTKQQ
jgi:pentatricopeptide repeat protein